MVQTRDYELIRECLNKYGTKMNNIEFYPIPLDTVSFGYRNYTPAYFEEIILKYEIEERQATNFRERFLDSGEAIFEVLKMYSKKDFIELFLQQDTSEISHQQMIELFEICIKFDSFKIAL
mmetsp:Transcript_4753/g.7172  ORF Transcript_4753/g.7172 Transcript_4753/m.7172 type:complete len:121 (+) Transcript_4753:1403-1765(+)